VVKGDDKAPNYGRELGSNIVAGSELAPHQWGSLYIGFPVHSVPQISHALEVKLINGSKGA